MRESGVGQAGLRIGAHFCLALQYNDLMKKKRIVENDKAKILQTIEELDQKKNEALNLAWQKVDSLFTHLFFYFYHLYIGRSHSAPRCIR